MFFSSFNGNWVDLCIAGVILFYLVQGWGRGFVFGSIDFASFILSFAISLKVYAWVGTFFAATFSIPKGIANAVGFLVMGLLVQSIFSFIIIFLYRLVYDHLLSKARTRKSVAYLITTDKVLGFLPAIGEALIFSAFILTLFVSLPVQGNIKKAIVSSRVGGYLVGHAQGFERQLDSIFGEAVNETLTFVTINANPSSDERVSLGFTQSELAIDVQAEAEMLRLVNQERVAVGLSLLTTSPRLQELAREYAKDMFMRGYFSHYNPEGESPFDRMKRYKITFLAAGENLALAPNVVLAHQGLMNSPGHRANILSPDFGTVGIGAIDGGMYGMMFVQEFTN